MSEDTQRIMRGSIESVTLTVDEDCTGHTCYLSIGDAKKCYATVTQDSITPTDGGCEVVFTLKQGDTLACKAGDCSMQMRTAYNDSAALATEWIPVTVVEAINKEILADVD